MFINYLLNDRRLRNDHIDRALSHVKYFFRTSFHATEGFDHESLSACKRSARLQCSADPSIPRPQKKLPFTLDLLLAFRKQQRGRRTIYGHMLSAALTMAFFCLLRNSEFLLNPRSKKLNSYHAFRACDIQFQIREGRAQAAVYVDAANIRSQQVTWELLHWYVSRFSRPRTTFSKPVARCGSGLIRSRSQGVPDFHRHGSFLVWTTLGAFRRSLHSASGRCV